MVSPTSPESPDIDPLLFSCEILAAKSPTYYDYVKVGNQLVRRHSEGPDLRRVPEAPETLEFEEHLPFQERVSSAKPLTRRRTIRAGTKRVRGSHVPGLPTLSERVEYPDSPITTRTPRSPPRIVSPPRLPHYTDEGERLVDIPARPITPERPPREKATRIKRRVTRRKIDFDATPPSPIERRPAAFASPEEEFGPPPDDLMGEAHPIQYERKVKTNYSFTQKYNYHVKIWNISVIDYVNLIKLIKHFASAHHILSCSTVTHSIYISFKYVYKLVLPAIFVNIT